MRYGLILAAAATLVAAPAQAKLRVVTSTETLAAITRSVGGERVTVQSLAAGSRDPHLIEPRPALVAPLSQADLLVYVGLDLEAAWLPRFIEQARNPRLRAGAAGRLDCSSTITVLDVPEARSRSRFQDQHPRGNPHYWLAPDNALRVAQAVVDRLRQLDPAGESAYRAGLQRFRDEVKRRQPMWLARAEALKGRKIVTYHRGWTYVAAWLGLVEVAQVEPAPGVTPTLLQLTDLAVRMKHEGVDTIIVAPYHAGATASLAAHLADARLIVVPSDVGGTAAVRDYVRLVDAVIDGLRLAWQAPTVAAAPTPRRPFSYRIE